ncbi:MAG: cell division protein FtsL [Alphaproteobacteria bacterium]
MKMFMMICLMVFCGTGLFYVKQMVQVAEDVLSDLNKDIAVTSEAVQVLKAEWSLLNDPTRLERLSSRYLGMEAPSYKQVASKELLPFLPKTSNDEELKRLFTSIAYGAE